MSEEILKALMQLFGIIARMEGLHDQKTNIVKSFLQESLNQKDAEKYLKIFKKHAQLNTAQTLDGKEKVTSVKDSSKMLRICTQINKELAQNQKIVLTIRILALVYADYQISAQELEFVSTMASVFNIDPKEFEAMLSYVKVRFKEDISKNSNFLLIGKEQPGNFNHFIPRNLNGLLLFLYLPSHDILMLKYLGKHNYYLNNIAIKPRSLYLFPTGSLIRGNRLETIYYSDVIAFFRSKVEIRPISFEAIQVNHTFSNQKHALQNINIAENGGRLIGIMGTSGVGKTTLLEVLNGNIKPRKGKVLINGKNIHEEKMEGVIGYVPQDDLLIEELTVYENLYFAAQLSMLTGSHQELLKRVDKVLEDLNLIAVKNLKVGSPLKRIISGGQRKRLNIGLELLRTPSVLFVDEPTSGLSSRDSENIMDLLKELSLKGTLIFTVIHQPSSNIFKMLDQLYILDEEGLPVYYGKPQEALSYFKSIANQINSEQVECIECGNINVEEIFDIIETEVVDEYGRFTGQRKITPEQWHSFFCTHSSKKEIEYYNEIIESTFAQPGFLKQIFIFIKRDFFSKYKNKTYLFIALLQAPLLAFILSYINRYANDGSSYIFYKNENVPVYIFISVIVALFMGLVMSAEEIYKDRKILKREQFLNLSWNSYLLSKLFILFLISAMQTTLFILLGNTIIGIEGMFWRYFLVLFSASCCGNIIGLHISSAFQSAVIIYICIPILLIPQLILGGLVTPFDKMNPSIASKNQVPLIAELVPSRWAFEALAVTQYRDNPYNQIFYDYDQKIALSEYKKVYYLPLLKEQILLYKANEKSNIDLIISELNKEAYYLNSLGFQLPENFDQAENISSTLPDHLQNYYQQIQLKAQNDKARLIEAHFQDSDQLDQLKRNYTNLALAKLVENVHFGQRISIDKGKIIGHIYPIYMDSQECRAHFFAPKKQFLGSTLSTFCYNLIALWTLSLILYVLLYLKVLKIIVNRLSRIHI